MVEDQGRVEKRIDTKNNKKVKVKGLIKLIEYSYLLKNAIRSCCKPKWFNVCGGITKT